MGAKTSDTLEPVELPSYGAGRIYRIRLPLYVYESYMKLPSYHKRYALKAVKAFLYSYSLDPEKVGKQIREVLKGNIDVDKLQLNPCETEHKTIVMLQDVIKRQKITIDICDKERRELKKIENSYKELRKLFETFLNEIKKLLEDNEVKNKPLALYTRVAKAYNDTAKEYRRLIGEDRN